MLQLEPIGSRIIARVLPRTRRHEVAGPDGAGVELVVPDYGMYNIPASRWEIREKNRADYEEMDDEQAEKYMAQVKAGGACSETRPLIRGRSILVCQVIAECRQARWSDPEFGDLFAVGIVANTSNPSTVFWSGFWRLPSNSADCNDVQLCDSTQKKVLVIPRGSEIVILDLEGLASERRLYLLARFSELATSPDSQ